MRFGLDPEHLDHFEQVRKQKFIRVHDRAQLPARVKKQGVHFGLLRRDFEVKPISAKEVAGEHEHVQDLRREDHKEEQPHGQVVVELLQHFGHVFLQRVVLHLQLLLLQVREHQLEQLAQVFFDVEVVPRLVALERQPRVSRGYRTL